MSALFLIIWLIFFIFRKNLRKEMLMMSLIFGIAGLLVERVYIHDWWRPLTILGTKISIEDFIFGFCIGGIAAVIYEFIFQKRIRRQSLYYQECRQKQIIFLFLGLFFILIFSGGIFLLHLNSFQASIIAFISSTVIIYFRRPDLILSSLITGGNAYFSLYYLFFDGIINAGLGASFLVF